MSSAAAASTRTSVVTTTKLCPLVFAGGGLKHGRAVGKSDTRGREPDGDPITIDDLHSTTLYTVFNLGELRVDTPEISSFPRRQWYHRRTATEGNQR